MRPPQSVNWPRDWRTVPLWSLFERVKDVGHPHEEMLSVYREYGVVRKDSRDDNFNKTAENRNIYQLVDDGWLLVNRMKAWQGSVGISPCRGIVSGHYICFRPKHEENSRFLNWLLRSQVYTTEYFRWSRGVRPSQVEIDNEGLRALPIQLPPHRTQAAIANFLDRESARIDALITKKLRIIELVRQRYRAQVDALTGRGQAVPVRRVSQSITSGPRGWSNQVSGAGSPFVRSANLRRNDTALRSDNVVFVEVATNSVEATRSRISAGDIIVGITGANTGWVGLVDSNLEGGYISQHVARIRPRNVVPEWLTFSVFSQRAQQQLLGGQYGGTKQQLGLEDLASLIIHVPSKDDQISSVRHLNQARSKSAHLLESLERQIRLLQEHRQALITAAVTGEIEVPRVSA